MELRKAIGSNRVVLAVPILIVLASAGLLLSSFLSTGDWFERSIELKGGTLLSVRTDSPQDVALLQEELSGRFGGVVVRELRSFSGTGLSVQVEAGTDVGELRDILEGLGVDTSESSVETIGPSLGEAFWSQAQISIVAALILMGIIVFVIFRTLVPSTAVIAAAVADIIVTLALMQVFSIELSLASFAALLMLIGYSIDTDILLTTRILRSTEGNLRERTWGAFKTGMTMTLTTLAVLAAVILTTTSGVLLAIALVLFLGLGVDIVMTWLMNATVIWWYADKRGL